MRRSAKDRASHLLAAAIAAAFCVPALSSAQDNKDQGGTTLEKVTVTGSAIPRTEAETASPLQIITKADIDRSGLTTTAEVVQAISSNSSGSVTPNDGNSFAAGASGVALRGLDVNSTLVLIDGRRAAPYALADDGQRSFVDLNSIPINEIERIEVLKDGASSLYGADAIAGVVNIITKKEFRGAEAWGEYGMAQHGGGAEKRFVGTLGGGSLAQNGHNAYIGIEYQRDEKITVGQRPFPYNTTNLSSVGGPDSRWGDPSSFLGSVYGTVTPASFVTPGDFTSGQALAGATSVPLRPCGAGSPQLTDGSGNVYCAQNQALYGDDQPMDERFGLFGRITVNLNEYAQVYVNASYYQNKVVFDSTPPQINNPFPINTNAIALPATLNNGALNPNDPFAAQGEAALINYAFGDINGGSQIFNQNYRFVTGVRGSFEGWDYDSAVVINHTSLVQTLYGFINYPQLIADIGSGAYSFINPSSNTQAVRNALAPTLRGTSTTDMNSIDFRITRSLFNLPGGPLGFAAGAEYRYEAADQPNLNPDNEAQGLGQTYTHGSRNVQAVYTEFDAPVLKTLEADVSARYDHYSDFGTGGLIPKVGLKWTPIDELALRATYSTGFRAPGFSENGNSAVGSFVGPTTPPCSYAANHPGNILNGCTTTSTSDAYTAVPYTIVSATAGNPQISPEKSDNFTLGFVFQPFKWLSGSLDYYKIRKRDAIEGAPLSPAITAFYAGQPAPTGYTTTPDKPDPSFPSLPPRLAAVSSSFINAASISTDGLDLNLEAKTKPIWGIRFLSDLEITDVLSYKVAQPGQDPVQYVGTDSPFALNSSPGIAQYRATWQNTAIFGKTGELSLIGHYASGITLYGLDVAAAGVCLDYLPNCRETHFIYFDMTGVYHLNKNVDFTGSILNIGDAKPPYEPSIGAGVNYDPTFAQEGIVGRYFTLGVRYRYH